jgi:hypothetical protein
MAVQLEAKIRFVLSTVPRMAQYTQPYIASVIGVEDTRTGKHVGSALRCILAGRCAIVTAWHVIDRAMSYPDFAVSAGYGKAPYVVHGELHKDESGDLAIYFLPEDYPPGTEKMAFWPENRIDRTMDRLASDYLFVHGFPSMQSVFSDRCAGVVSKSLPYGAMQRLEDLPNDLKSFQFAVDFSTSQIRDEAGQCKELPDPHGLSGSPVWRIGASGRSARAWTPEWSLLAGIITQWREDAGILVATSASRLDDLLHPRKV